jgi:hypothetical protein
VRHTAAVVTSVKDEALNGRWVACISLVVSTGKSAVNALRNLSARRYRSIPVVPSGLANGTSRTASGICVVLPDERAERLADAGDEGSDVDQCLDVGDPATVAIAVTSVLRREISWRMDMVEPQG